MSVFDGCSACSPYPSTAAATATETTNCHAFLNQESSNDSRLSDSESLYAARDSGYATSSNSRPQTPFEKACCPHSQTDCAERLSSLAKLQDHVATANIAAASNDASSPSIVRRFEDLLAAHQAGHTILLDDVELLTLLREGAIATHALENTLRDNHRAVKLRRCLLEGDQALLLQDLPWHGLDYEKVHGACAENVVGYVPIPVGISGPLIINGEAISVPLGTTEGTLIASVSRGCKALNASGGVTVELVGDGMTRAPVVQFPDLRDAALAKRFIDSASGQILMKDAFDATTRHGSLTDVTAHIAGRYLYLRVRARTGEAMGMNMISKGTEAILRRLQDSEFPQMRIISISGNLCSDKKPAAINWIQGRGKSVVVEAEIPALVLEKILRTSARSLAELNQVKNYVGSALAGTASGGFNAHAANVVAAIFLATGQDAAQVTTSSNCLTMFEATDQGTLVASVTMPSIEVGTIGGGTHLPAQAAMLQVLGCSPKQDTTTGGTNAARLAQVIAATVLAAELSLCSALTTGELVTSHLKHNRR